jgi:hypothetical protein
MELAKPKFQETESGIILPPEAGVTTESGLHVPALSKPESSQEGTGAVSRRSWRRGKVKTPPANQEALERLRKAKRRKAQKQARKTRKRNR